MDNLSHSFAGLVAGELVHRSLPEESDSQRRHLRRKLLLVTSWAASNFPDLDLILTPLLPAPLGYLLHHRGHTHTLLYALPQALLLVGLICAFWPSARQLLRTDSSSRKGFTLALVIGFSLHLLMDSLNSYGIHPFHPFNSDWYFGDMVFILEPFFWVTLGVPFVMTLKRLWLKGLLFIALVVTPFVLMRSEFLVLSSFILLAAMAGFLALMQRRDGARGRKALLLSVFASLGFVLLQGLASRQAESRLMAALKVKDPTSQFLDAALNSYPTNPLCWGFVSIEKNEAAGIYRLRRGLLSLNPDSVPVTSCPSGLTELQPQDEVLPHIAYLQEESGQLAKLRDLRKRNCHFEAWLRFARAPLLTEDQALDIRFSRAGLRGNFTTLSFEDFANRECSRFVPQWNFPRGDLLDPAAPPSGSPVNP